MCEILDDLSNTSSCFTIPCANDVNGFLLLLELGLDFTITHEPTSERRGIMPANANDDFPLPEEPTRAKNF
jgi:hypothetical protein